ncbi:hypothetical protein BLNAU_4935 [Blattamonas nauphoetae]|uniref:Uncharacterized protein n=1 Tax=Blattamonas nauphoetae TaxID=2049346 RepID=A0ABQ9Y8J1_9EUKA|nr:hypothetical protein BLNAU_4935 [Blattamonas nauphoetae]
MKTNISHSRTSADASLTHSPTSPSSVKPEEKPFVYFATNSDLSFEEKSAIYCSLVSLVKAGYPFDDALLSRAARFLKDLEPKWDAPDLADKLVTELVPSSDGSPSDFIESPFHRPTLEFVVASPIVMAFSSSLSFVENHRHLETSLININDSLTEWKRAGPEVAQSGIRMLQAMFTGEFEDTLDQMMTHNKNGSFGRPVVKNCLPISHRLSRMTPTHLCGLCSDVGSALIAGADEQILRLSPIVLKWFALLGSSFSTRLSLTVSSSTVLSPNNSWRPFTMHGDQIIFPNLDFWSSQKHASILSSKWDVPHIHAIPQPSTICFMIVHLVDYSLSLNSRSKNRATHSRPKSKNQSTLDDLLVLTEIPLHDTSLETEQLVAQLVTAVQQRAHCPKRKRGSTALANTSLMSILENSQVVQSMTGKEGSESQRGATMRNSITPTLLQTSSPLNTVVTLFRSPSIPLQTAERCPQLGWHNQNWNGQPSRSSAGIGFRAGVFVVHHFQHNQTSLETRINDSFSLSITHSTLHHPQFEVSGFIRVGGWFEK